MILSLLHHVTVIIVIAYILTRTKLYSEIIIKKEIKFKNKILLILIFGAFSIYGTINGVEIYGAIANVRDLGPAIGGLIAGPFVGLGAGIIGATHRFFLRGPTQQACCGATVLIGLIAGLIYRIRKGKLISLSGAALFAVLMEIFHMGLVILISTFNNSFTNAWNIVKKVSFPMIIANVFGMVIFMFISKNLVTERRTKAEKERIDSELRIAHDIQMGIVPKTFPPFPHRKEFDLYAVIEPARQVGGDLYDFFFIDENKLCFLIGDVSGKGVPASLFMAVTKTLIKAHSHKKSVPNQILKQVNQELNEENDSAMFVTLILAILNTKTGRVDYCNAGHNPPYCVKKNGQIFQIERTKGIALGVYDEAEFTSKNIQLEKNDILYLYTDGVNEAMDENGNQFSYKRIENNILQKNYELSPELIIRKSFHEIKHFVKDTIQSDDITLLVIKYLEEVQ